MCGMVGAFDYIEIVNDNAFFFQRVHRNTAHFARRKSRLYNEYAALFAADRAVGRKYLRQFLGYDNRNIFKQAHMQVY